MAKRKKSKKNKGMQYKLNVYQYTSGLPVKRHVFRSKEKVKDYAKEYEGLGFNVSVTSLKNGKRKYWHNELWDEF